MAGGAHKVRRKRASGEYLVLRYKRELNRVARRIEKMEKQRARRRSCAGYSRHTVLLLCALLLIALFAATGFLSRAFHQKQAALAESWFEKGNAYLAVGHARDARDAYRNALIFEPQNTNFQLHLAQALAAFGQADESRGYLVNLFTQAPGDGEVNLELAHLAARQGNVNAAIRYYHGAIYGAWDLDPVTASRNARIELCDFLVEQGDTMQAEAELIALAANVPAGDAALHVKVGNLFVRNGDLNHALSEFQAALKTSQDDAAAMAGAGTVAYRLGHYAEAVGYLDRARRANSQQTDVTDMLITAQYVVDGDPFAPNLSEAERARRAAMALAQAISRVEKCVVPSTVKEVAPIQALLERAKAGRGTLWSERSLSAHPERIELAMRTVFDLESEADRECGKPQRMDLALSLIEQMHQDIANGAPGS